MTRTDDPVESERLFEEVYLPRLAAAYEAGRLVPFLGSGMSVPVCADWRSFVDGLEREAAGRAAASFGVSGVAREDLIRRANNAVRALKAKASGTLQAAVRQALFTQSDVGEIPPQARALAEIAWPLVLSTNYDNCFAAAARAQLPERPLAVVGRGVEDCQQILNSLSVAGRPLLWALQGYLDSPYAADSGSADLSAPGRQLVVGHEEYRRVTYRDLHFRRAFAEVFRQRSLLFLGAGIQETYLQELFGEIMEYYGPSTRPHYAFVQQGDLDPEFMRARFQIVLIEYERGRHERVVERLGRLAKTVTRPRRAPVAWSWGRIVPDAGGHWTSVPDLEIVRGPLPAVMRVDQHECLAVSAGGRRSGSLFFLSEGIQRAVAGWGVEASEQPVKRSEYLGEYPGRHVFAVRARTENDERGLSLVYDASMDLFERVAESHRCIRMQLLAVGGTDKLGTPARSSARNFPERFSFVQTVRAWGDWREAHPDVDCRLALHVVLHSVYLDIASGRIDVLELLSARDIRFFVEVAGDAGDLERRLFQEKPTTRLDKIVQQLQLSPDHWTFEVTPPPSLDVAGASPLRGQESETLRSLGVVPGSTMHFRRLPSA